MFYSFTFQGLKTKRFQLGFGQVKLGLRLYHELVEVRAAVGCCWWKVRRARVVPFLLGVHYEARDEHVHEHCLPAADLAVQIRPEHPPAAARLLLPVIRDVQPALIGRHCVTQTYSAPVQYNGIV